MSEYINVLIPIVTLLGTAFAWTARKAIWGAVGSAVSAAFESFKKPLNILTLSLTTFSFKQVDINVWSAPESVNVKLVFVTSVSSVKLETPKNSVHATIDPDQYMPDIFKANNVTKRKIFIQYRSSTTFI